MNTRTFKIFGFLLLSAAILGFATVADDPRHIGEFSAVSGILISGVALLLAGFYPRIAFVIAVQWVAVGIGTSMVVGAVTDHMAIFTAFGVVSGLFLAYCFRTRHEQANRAVA